MKRGRQHVDPQLAVCRWHDSGTCLQAMGTINTGLESSGQYLLSRPLGSRSGGLACMYDQPGRTAAREAGDLADSPQGRSFGGMLKCPRRS